MRSAKDFDAYYKQPDPWGIANAHRRDRVLSRTIQPFIKSSRVLELGCGEGHLTATVFSPAKFVAGFDISPIAIERASALGLTNASFNATDFLTIDFSGYDAIAAIECLYYLSSEEQETFFDKLRSHRGIFIMTAPIIGANEFRTYYTHSNLLSLFARYDLAVVEWHNLNAYRKMGVGGFAAAVATRLTDRALPWVPERFVYQRCYVLRKP
jgi:cyclopropane fatty-acyl-phospholipid synthase-like methyltransferase